MNTKPFVNIQKPFKKKTMKTKFKINDAVVVNTGGENSKGYICYPTKNIHGFYWEKQDSYCVHFPQTGAKHYIPAKYIRAN